MMVGGLSVALNALLGKSDDEIMELQKEIIELKNAVAELTAKNITLKQAYDDMQERLVAKLDLKLKPVK
jgi:regulator of replication initiation timing